MNLDENQIELPQEVYRHRQLSNDSVISVSAFVILSVNVKLNGPIGVNQSIHIPIALLILSLSSIDES